jgi:5-methylcytosine-specific restriction endonuclease McrA
LDLLARRATFERAKHRCERCLKPDRLQWHHVYSRAIVTLRWDLDNLVALCAGCHLWWHHNPLDAAEWFDDHCDRTDPKRKLRLAVSRRTVRKTDYAALRFMLERYVEVGG